MHYRTSVDALEQRHAELGSEIARVEKEIAELGGAQLALRRERAELAAEIEEQQPPSPILERVRIASPCGADWEKMTGDDRVRFCGECKKHVYNITNMSRREAEALLTENASACVRFFQRADGTIMTQDCAVGVKKKQRRKVALAVLGGTAMWGAGVAAAASSVAGAVQRELDERAQAQALQAEEQTLPVLRGPTVAPPMPHTTPGTSPTPTTSPFPHGRWVGGKPSINRGGDFF